MIKEIDEMKKNSEGLIHIQNDGCAIQVQCIPVNVFAIAKTKTRNNISKYL